MRIRVLLPAMFGLSLAGCSAWRAESRLYDEGAETVFFRDQQARAARPVPPVAAAVAEAAPPVLPAKREWGVDPAERVAELLPPGSGDLLRIAADDAGTEKALAAAPLDLDTVRALAAVRSPAARAARLSWRAAVEQVNQGAWLEDLLAAYRPYLRSAPPDADPWPSTTALRGEMADAAAAMAAEEARAAAASAVAAAEEAWFEQWHAEESVRLKSAFHEILRHTAEVAARRYATGLGMQEEQFRVEVEIADIETDHLRHLTERSMAESKLDALLARAPGAVLPEAAPPRFPDALPPANRVETAAREGNPMARAKSFAAQEALVALRMAERMAHGEGMSLDAGSGEAFLRGLRRRLEAADSEAEAAAREAGSMAREAWTALDTALREARVGDRTKIPLARQSFEIAGRAYEAGTGKFADYLRAWWMYVEARHDAVEARMRAGFARAALLRAVGAEITERPR